MDEPSPPPSTAPGTASENPMAPPKQRAPNLQELSALLGMGGDHGLPTRTPDPEMVMETLDAEMARIEQALVRSGWTSWVGTAALAGVLWVFVSLFDVGAMFPWPRFAALVALLSFVQEFVYCLDNSLRPRRGLGLLVGDQMRMVVSAETLPFARRYYLFEGVRALLLVAASWYLLPALIGWGWLLPFVWYAAAVVTMCVLFALSLRPGGLRAGEPGRAPRSTGSRDLEEARASGPIKEGLRGKGKPKDELARATATMCRVGDLAHC